MNLIRNALGQLVSGLGVRLRFPQLFLLAATVLVVDVLIPDFLPFTDEILLALATVILGSLKRPPGPRAGDDEQSGPVIDIEPRQ